MILKLLLFLGIAFAIYYLFFKKKPLFSSKKEKLEGSDMVECANCGVYAELNDSLLSKGKYYCSKECLEKA
jgi:uncharacterized protein